MLSLIRVLDPFHWGETRIMPEWMDFDYDDDDETMMMRQRPLPSISKIIQLARLVRKLELIFELFPALPVDHTTLSNGTRYDKLLQTILKKMLGILKPGK